MGIIYKEKIEKYLNGSADESERQLVESWFINGSENIELRKILEADWAQTTLNLSDYPAEMQTLLERIHHKLWLMEAGKRVAGRRRLSEVFMNIAAILFIPLVISAGLMFYYKSNLSLIKNQQVLTSITAPVGSRVTFSLPDGTTGMLNSGSTLSYLLPFNHQRNVEISGEAWFDVARDKNHPFTVSAGSSHIKVLGTKFNICAYPDDGFVEVVLEEGKLEFDNGDVNRKIVVLPNERVLSRNGLIDKTLTEPLKYSSWKEGKLVFRGDNMTEVVRRIERWYNVQIEISDKELENYSFRATFEDDKIEDVLNFLKMTSPINYKIENRRMLPDGTFEKLKIIISLKK